MVAGAEMGDGAAVVGVVLGTHRGGGVVGGGVSRRGGGGGAGAVAREVRSNSSNRWCDHDLPACCRSSWQRMCAGGGATFCRASGTVLFI